MHPFAEPAAEAAEFAGSQGMFWPMHDAIYANQHHLSVPLLIAFAASLKLPAIALRDALADGRFAPKVEADFTGGVRSGVNGTPTFFINGVRFDSPLGAAALPAAIDAMMPAGGVAADANSPRNVRVHVEDGSHRGIAAPNGQYLRREGVDHDSCSKVSGRTVRHRHWRRRPARGQSP